MSPKLLNSVAHKLARAVKQIEDLKRRNSELEGKNAELTLKLLRARSRPAGRAPPTPDSTSDEDTGGTSEKSFMRPTSASEFRQAAVKNQRVGNTCPAPSQGVTSPEYTIHGISYKYTDGRLVNEDAVGNVLKDPHYLQSTCTSRLRQRERIAEAAQADLEPEWVESVENPAWYDTQPAVTNTKITADTEANGDSDSEEGAEYNNWV